MRVGAPQGEMRLLLSGSPVEVENLARAGGNPKAATREDPEDRKVKRVVLPSAGETVGENRTLQIGNNTSRSVQA